MGLKNMGVWGLRLLQLLTFGVSAAPQGLYREHVGFVLLKVQGAWRNGDRKTIAFSGLPADDLLAGTFRLLDSHVRLSHGPLTTRRSSHCKHRARVHEVSPRASGDATHQLTPKLSELQI